MKFDLKSALERRGMSQQALADAIGRGKGYVSELASGKKQPSIETLDLILAALDADISEIVAPRQFIAVAGRVGAGAEVDLEDAYAKGDGLYHVACPPQLNPNGIVAVEVTGDSMSPTYPPGTVLFYGRDALGVPTEAIGRICVCEDSDGRAWVKHLKTGSSEGTFSLISINPEADNRHGVRLKWAAPVKLALPPEYVKRIEI